MLRRVEESRPPQAVSTKVTVSERDLRVLATFEIRGWRVGGGKDWAALLDILRVWEGSLGWKVVFAAMCGSWKLLFEAESEKKAAVGEEILGEIEIAELYMRAGEETRRLMIFVLNVELIAVVEVAMSSSCCGRGSKQLARVAQTGESPRILSLSPASTRGPRSIQKTTVLLSGCIEYDISASGSHSFARRGKGSQYLQLLRVGPHTLSFDHDTAFFCPT